MVGGGESVTPLWTEADADVIVSEPGEWERADRHDVVYLADDEEIDITGLDAFDLSGTVVVGGRYKPDVEAGKLVVNDSGPGSAAYRGVIRAHNGEGHVEGIAMQGPSWYPDRAEEYKRIDETDVRCWPGYEHISKDGTTRSERDDLRTDAFARGINLRSSGTVRNVDVHGFTHANISVGSSSHAPDVTISRSELTNACMPGLGYPINIYNGNVVSEYNFFDAYRHSLTLFGHHGSGYVSRHDVHGPNAMLTPVDAHCLAENGGDELVAGSYVTVEDSTFLAAKRFSTPGWYSSTDCPAIGIRGRAAPGGDGYTTYRCQFAHTSLEDAFDQRNVPFPTDWEWGDNEFGIENWTDGAGAPVDWAAGADAGTGSDSDSDSDSGVGGVDALDLAERRRARGRAVSDGLDDQADDLSTLSP